MSFFEEHQYQIITAGVNEATIIKYIREQETRVTK